MIEIIKRREGFMSQKEQIAGQRVQASYNSWGHLVVRIIDEAPGKDTLVVFDAPTSAHIIGFIKRAFKLQEEERCPF